MALVAMRTRAEQASTGAHVPVSEDRKRLFLHALRSENRSRLEATLALASTMLPIADSGEDWDETPGLLGVPNGVVELRTGELRDGRPDDRITMQAGVAYDPKAACPRFDEFLREIFSGDDDLVRYVKRALGYALTAEATEDKLFFFMGSGRNGKSTLLETARAAAGDYGREVSADAFLARRENAHSTEIADLELKRFVTCEELGDRTLDADRLKSLTGGGHFSARHIRQDSREMKQTWSIFGSTNGQPNSPDNSVAWWERIVVVPFKRFFGHEQQEAGLDAKLAAELPGVLRWLVEGAAEWYRDGLGEKPASSQEAVAGYREDVDPLAGAFEAGILVADGEEWTPTSKLWDAYYRWASDHGRVLLGPRTEHTFGSALAGRFSRERRREDGVQQRGFCGVRVGVVPSPPEGTVG
jgi:putative DNA primase/helicase